MRISSQTSEAEGLHGKIIALQNELDIYENVLSESTLLATTDEKGLIKKVNKGFCSISGYAKNELIGQTHGILKSGHHPQSFFIEMWKTIRSGKVWMGEVKNKAKSGNYFWVDLTILPVPNKKKRIAEYVSLGHDITKLKITESEFEESQRMLNLTIECGEVGIWSIDFETRTQKYNDMWGDLLGYDIYEVDKMKPNPYDVLIHPDDIEQGRDQLNKYLAGDTPYYHNTVRMRRKDGTWAWLRSMGKLIEHCSDGSPKLMVGTHVDVSIIKEAQEKVMTAMLAAEDKERKRIAKELHDSLGQLLTTAYLNFNNLKTSIEFENGGIDRFEKATDYLKSAMQEARSISHNLMPKSIEDFGYVKTIQSMISDIQQAQPDLEFGFYENLNDQRMPAELELGLFRVTQEALNNMLKHAKARNVDIQLVKHENSISLTIEDDGRGISPDKLLIDQDNFGLSGMKNRVEVLGGTIDIDSTEGKGTLISIRIDLK